MVVMGVIVLSEKKPIRICYLLYESNYMTFWKRQNYQDSKKISDYQGRGKRLRFRKILPREHLNGLGGMCDNDLQLICTEER